MATCQLLKYLKTRFIRQTMIATALASFIFLLLLYNRLITSLIVLSPKEHQTTQRQLSSSEGTERTSTAQHVFTPKKSLLFIPDSINISVPLTKVRLKLTTPRSINVSKKDKSDCAFSSHPHTSNRTAQTWKDKIFGVLSAGRNSTTISQALPDNDSTQLELGKNRPTSEKNYIDLLDNSDVIRKPTESVWCGRPIENLPNSQKSFVFLQKWVSSGGVNVMGLFQQANISCSVRCSKTMTFQDTLHIYEGLRVNKMQKMKVIQEYASLSTRLSELEMKILKADQPVTEFTSVASELHSKVKLLDPISQLKVGQVLTARIDLYDGNGLPRTNGGDEIRAWIFDSLNGAGTPGHIADLNNGSYLATIPLRWAGKQEISLALHHPRELIRTMVFLRFTLGTMRYLTAAFEDRDHGESTLCMWYPLIPGYKHICNLTSQNGGMPWYCGKPFNENLTCLHWTRSQASSFVDPLPVTGAEGRWLEKMNRKPYARLIRFPESTIDVKGVQEPNQNKPCSSIPHAVTWAQNDSPGWFWKEKWYSPLCDLHNLTINKTRQWLRNKAVYILGDSNSKRLYRLVSKDFCTVFNLPELLFPGPLNCSNPETNTSIFFQAHAHPFNLPHPDHYREYNVPISRWLDDIDDNEDPLVVIHIYLHFAQFNLPLFTFHTKDIFKGVSKLLKRNPKAKIVFRGPHIAFKGWPVHSAGGDFMAREFDQILRKEFSSLKDRVMYLNGLKMTTAVGNLNFHPQSFVDKAMVNTIFNHFVGR